MSRYLYNRTNGARCRTAFSGGREAEVEKSADIHILNLGIHGKKPYAFPWETPHAKLSFVILFMSSGIPRGNVTCCPHIHLSRQPHWSTSSPSAPEFSSHGWVDHPPSGPGIRLTNSAYHRAGAPPSEPIIDYLRLTAVQWSRFDVT